MPKKRKNSIKIQEINKEELELTIGRLKSHVSNEDYEFIENIAEMINVVRKKMEEGEDEEKIREFLNQILNSSKK